MEENLTRSVEARKFAAHGWVGLLLVAVFWSINWGLPGLRTHWAFFPMWLGYCLTIDALVLYRTGTSLLTRSRRRYAGLFLISAPVWWIFEAVNTRLNNWHYVGSEGFSPLVFAVSCTLSFTTVIPAVFGSAELLNSFHLFRRLPRGPVIRPDRRTAATALLIGLAMFASMLAWPKIFFPFVWISLYLILEPVNIWLGNPTLADWTKRGDWKPVLTLWAGVLLTAFFWEMWNYFSYPKWVYSVAWGGWLKIFEMPLLGYGGYLPFALELFALYHLIVGFFGSQETGYLHIYGEE